MNDKAASSSSWMSALAQQIGSDIEKQCTEHITTGGDRFFGVSWAEICRILKQYGYKDKAPF